jgi:2-polyprenyl-3-methyl-5-hydroxy-6-metoxy-1,4-benzoquinol methylase
MATHAIDQAGTGGTGSERSEQASPRIEVEQVQSFVEHVFGFLGGMVVAGMIYLGDKMGLYKALRGMGPVTPAELAAQTGLQERWLTEWLRGQAAAGLLDYAGEGRFELSDVQSLVLADEESSLVFSAGGFSGLPSQVAVLERLPESFRTGIGLPYDAFGEGGAHAVARMFAPWFRQMLVPLILPALDGVVGKLEAGAKAADVGCGAGIAVITMARAFPASDFHGYDISKHALAIAERNKAEAGVTNVTFHDANAAGIPGDGSFDLVTAFDCIHDMANPSQVLAAVRAALKPEGTVLIADIKGFPTFEENVENNPMAAMMYGFSVMSCMSSALSTPDGEGLGTLGFHEQKAREMLAAAGFTRVQTHDFENPINVYYEVRP